jgi:hypothetical protein
VPGNSDIHIAFDPDDKPVGVVSDNQSFDLMTIEDFSRELFEEQTDATKTGGGLNNTKITTKVIANEDNRKATNPAFVTSTEIYTSSNTSQSFQDLPFMSSDTDDEHATKTIVTSANIEPDTSANQDLIVTRMAAAEFDSVRVIDDLGTTTGSRHETHLTMDAILPITKIMTRPAFPFM